MATFPILDAEVSNYEFDPRTLRELRRGLYDDYRQLTKICRTLPLRYMSAFTDSRLCAERRCLTRRTAALLNEAAAALRERDSLAGRLYSVVSHAPDLTQSRALIEPLAHALVHTLDVANSALAHLERISQG